MPPDVTQRYPKGMAPGREPALRAIKETTMRSFLAGLALSLVAGMAAADDDARLVTIVATGEPQTQLMAMVLTMQSIQQGAEARILLCGPGGDLALSDAPESATAPQAPRGMSPQGLMGKIMETGAPVEVCAIYLPNKGVDASALLPGVGVAKPPAIAAELIKDDVRILSF
jgi:hypothetical protein